MKQIKLILLFLLVATNTYGQLNENFEAASDITSFPPVGGTLTWTLGSGAWKIINKEGANFSWDRNNYPTSTTPAHNGIYAAYLQKENVSPAAPIPEDWLVTPAINIGGTTNPKLSFYSRNTLPGDQGGIYKVLISTTGQTDTNSFTPLQTWTELQLSATQTEYKKITVNLPTNIGNTIYLAFVMIGDDRDRWLIDDVTVGSTCPAPLTPVATDITANSAKLSWENTGASQWEVEVMPDTSSPTGTGTIVSQNSYLTGNILTVATNYKFYVRSLCPPGGTSNPSEWVGPVYFVTTQPGKSCSAPIVIPSSLPYIKTKERFMANDGSSGPGSNCGAGSGAYNRKFYTVYSYYRPPFDNATVDIKVNSSRNETGVFIYGSCADIGVNCLAGAAYLTPMEKTIQNFNVVGGTIYYIVVSTATANDYSLTITEDCTTPIEAQFTVISDCDISSPFSAAASLLNMGGATSILATLYEDDIVLETKTLNAPGAVIFNPIDHGKIVKILFQNQQDPNCILLSKNLSILLCPPANDECANAVTLTSGTSDTEYYLQGTLNGASNSPEPNNCLGKDVWYTFTATTEKQLIEISSIAGDNLALSHALYQGNCDNLTEIYCDGDGHSIANNLVPGLVYKIRVYISNGYSETTFKISTTGFPFTCMDDNLQSATIKGLFKNLINYLGNIQGPVTGPFTCPQLTALVPYITDPNPKIYNFTPMESGMAFSFSDHGGDYDVIIGNWPPNQQAIDVNFYSYTAPDQAANMYVTFANGDISNKRNLIKHIDFCPANPPCPQNTGKIDISPGSECVVAGAPTSFNFLTEDTNIASYLWVFFKDEEIVATSQLANPVMTFTELGNYTAKLTVTSQGGCKTVFHNVFIVKNSCADYCTELQNSGSEYTKSVYIKLINKLLDVYGTGNTALPTTYTCPELITAFYNTDSYLHNVRYDPVTSILKFAIYANPDSNYFDVAVKNYGHIADINLLNFENMEIGGIYPTIYSNGVVDNANHYIQNVNFCEGCYVSLYSNIYDIEMNPGLSCATLGTPTTFSFSGNYSSDPLQYYNWGVLDSNWDTIYSSELSEIQVTFDQPGSYTIAVYISGSEDACRDINFTKRIIVSEECNSCTDINPESADITKLYINLINYLSSTYPPGAIIPSPISCPQLDALAPYITDDNPKIWNLHYNGSNLRFSFSNNGTNYDAEFPGEVVVKDINLSNYNTAETLTNFTYYKVFHNGDTGILSIKHVNFCPEIDCPSIAGSIELNSGESCVPLNISQQFNLDINTSNIVGYKWMFFDKLGSTYTTSILKDPSCTYNTEGNYFIKVIVTDNLGCETEFYKTVTVSDSCGDACTETNPDSESVKELYIELLNYLISLNNIPDGFTCPKLSNLSPYITDVEPRIYNPQYANNGKTLIFSFSQNDSDPDVVIERLGTITDINLFSYTSSVNDGQYVVTFADGKQSLTHSARHINFCPDPLPCESHIAFVIDESESIKDEEVTNIKLQLTNFINQQYEQQTGNTISFTGMSDSDTNTRNDNVMGKLLSEADKQPFLNWISSYKSGYTPGDINMGLSPNSDYWASGLKYILDKSITPDIIIVLTDGSQTNDVNGLKEIVQRVNSESKLFVYGIGNGFYVDGNNQFDQTVFNSTMEVENQWPTVTSHPVSYPLLTYDTFQPHTGSYSLKLNNPGDWAEVYVHSTTWVEINNQEPTEYVYSGWVRNEQSPAELVLFMNKEDEQGYFTHVVSVITPAQPGWHHVEGSFMVPAYMKKLNLRIDNNGTGDIWFDDIKIVKKTTMLPNGTNPIEVTAGLRTSLRYLLELPELEFPVESLTDFNTGIYYADTNKFVHLNNEELYFSNNLADANIGCNPEYIPKDFCDDCETFQPEPGKVYWLSAWVKEEQNVQVHAYTNATIELIFEDAEHHEFETFSFLPTGEIIDGWQRIASKFEIPAETSVMKVELVNLSQGIPVYFDDIRIHPISGSMKSFVYDPETFRLMAELDDNNYSTFYEYDKEGGLIRIKKETSKGVKTIQESRSGTVINPVSN